MIVHSIKQFLTGTLLSRLSGLLRDVAMAAAFGSSVEISCFYVAYRGAHILRRVIGEGGLMPSFLPTFQDFESESVEKSHKFFKDVSATIITIILGLIALITLLPLNSFTFTLLKIMLPGCLFIFMNGMISGLLQIKSEFFSSAFSPVVFNIIWIAGALLPIDDTLFHVKVLCVLISVSYATQTCFLFFIARKHLRKVLSSFSFSLFSFDTRSFLIPLSLSLLGALALQIGGAIDLIIATSIHPKAAVYMTYSLRLFHMPYALLGVSASSVLLAVLSKNKKISDHEHAIQKSCLFVFSFAFPITCLTFLGGHYVVGILFERAAFHYIDTLMTSYSLYGYILGLIPGIYSAMLSSILFAEKKYAHVAKSSLCFVILNTILSALFALYFSLGMASISYATSLSLIGYCFILHNNASSSSATTLYYTLKKECLPFFNVSILSTLVTFVALPYIYTSGGYIVECCKLTCVFLLIYTSSLYIFSPKSLYSYKKILLS